MIAAVREVVPADRPLLAGAARESTRATIAACRRAAALGVSAVMVRTPSFYKNMMTSDAFVRHYTEVADASPAPVILYNVTVYTGVTLQADAVGLLSQHPNIVGVKESGNDMQLLARLPVGVGRRGLRRAVRLGDVVLLGARARRSRRRAGALRDRCPTQCATLMRARRRGAARRGARRCRSSLMPLARSIGAQHGVPGAEGGADAGGI